MDIAEFARLFPQKMAEVKQFVEGDDGKSIMGKEAKDHFTDSFTNEGFTDETLDPWEDVKRRDKDSPWYGHNYPTSKFSSAKATAKILHGEGHLAQSLRAENTEKGAKITSDLPYSAVHQFGLKAKVYGKHEFTMPARPFMGKSKELKTKIETKLEKEIINIITK